MGDDAKMQQTLSKRDMRTKKPAPSEDARAQHRAQSALERVDLVPVPEVSESGNDDEMRDATALPTTPTPNEYQVGSKDSDDEMRDATASSVTQEPNQEKQKIQLIEASLSNIQE